MNKIYVQKVPICPKCIFLPSPDFVQAMVQAEAVPKWLTRSETKLLHQLIKVGVAPLADIATTQVALGAVDRLITRGLVMLSCFTPTDAAHVLA